VFVILCYCVCNFCVVYCFECVCVILCIVLCIVVPLPPGIYPLAVNNNNNNNNNNKKPNKEGQSESNAPFLFSEIIFTTRTFKHDTDSSNFLYKAEIVFTQSMQLYMRR
jgi:hypothetical protein